MKTQFSPQISRFFTAKPVVVLFKTVILAGMTVFFLLALYGIFYPEKRRFNQIKQKLLADPNSAQSHFELGQFYQKHGVMDRAEEEFIMAQRLADSLANVGQRKKQQNKDVLGESTTKLRQLREGERILEEKLNYWKEVAQQKPDYRDAYIQIAFYAYQLNQLDLAKQALKKAAQLDPNNETVARLQKLIYKTR